MNPFDALKNRALQIFSVLPKRGQGLYLRSLMWVLGKLLKRAATQDDLADAVTCLCGAVGLAKRHAPSKYRLHLEAADSALDKLHRELGESKT